MLMNWKRVAENNQRAGGDQRPRRTSTPRPTTYPPPYAHRHRSSSRNYSRAAAAMYRFDRDRIADRWRCETT
jgi:hypothetical protein